MADPRRERWLYEELLALHQKAYPEPFEVRKIREWDHWGKGVPDSHVWIPVFHPVANRLDGAQRHYFLDARGHHKLLVAVDTWWDFWPDKSRGFECAVQPGIPFEVVARFNDLLTLLFDFGVKVELKKKSLLEIIQNRERANKDEQQEMVWG